MNDRTNIFFSTVYVLPIGRLNGTRVKDNNPLARKRHFFWILKMSRLVRAARKTWKFHNLSIFINSFRRYFVWNIADTA